MQQGIDKEELKAVATKLKEKGLNGDQIKEGLKLYIQKKQTATTGGGESEPGKPLGSEEPTQNLEGGSPSPLQSQLEQKAEEAVEANQVPKDTFVTEDGDYVPKMDALDRKLQAKYNILSPNLVQEAKRDIVSSKGYTPQQTVKQAKERLSEINSEIESIKTPPMATADGRSILREDEIADLQKKEELKTEAANITQQIKEAEKSNQDILMAELGATYKIDGEEVSFTDFHKKLRSAELTDKLKEDPASVNIEVSNDPETEEFLEYQIEGAKMGAGERAMRGAAETFMSFADAIDVKGTELQTAVFGVGTDFDIDNLPIDARAPFLAAKRAEERGEDVEDAFLQAYYANKELSREKIRGIQTVVEEDAIDRLVAGDLTGAAKEIGVMAVTSAPYTLAALTPAGMGLIFNTAQTDSYYKGRQDGLSKQEAFLASVGTGAVEFGDALLEKAFFLKGLNQATKTARRAAAAAGYSKEQMTQFAKDAAMAYIKEVPTEFAQGSLTSIIEDASRGREITIENFRQGTLEAMAGLPQSTIVASPNLARIAFSPAKKISDLSKMEDSALNLLFESANPNLSKMERKAMRDAYIETANDIQQANTEAEQVQEKATAEEKGRIVDIAKKQAVMQNALKSNALTEETRKDLEERISQLDTERESLINEIQERDEITKDKEPMLEGVQAGRTEEETGQESAELRTEETGEEVEDAVQQVQGQAEEGVLRNQRMEEAREEEQAQETEQEEAVTQEQFNSALEIIEPLASQRENSITPEQAEQIFEALGEGASSVIDVSTLRDKSAVELYNELSDIRDEQATAPTQPTTQETETVQEQPEVVEQEGETTEAVDEGDRAVAEESVRVINDSLREVLPESENKVKERIDRVRETMQERVDRAKSDKAAKDFTARLIKDVSREANIGGVSRSVLNKLLGQIPKANRKNLKSIIEDVLTVIGGEVRKSKVRQAESLQEDAKKQVSKGRISKFQEDFTDILYIDLSTIPNTPEGDAVLAEISDFYKNIREGSPAKKRSEAKKLFSEYSPLAQDNLDAIEKYYEAKQEGVNKAETIALLYANKKLTAEQVNFLNTKKLKAPTKPKEEQTESEQALIQELKSSITAAARKITPKDKSTLIEQDEANRLIINYIDAAKSTSNLEGLSKEALKELNKLLTESLPDGDLTAVGRGITELAAKEKERKVEQSLREASPKTGFDLANLFNMKDFFSAWRNRKLRNILTTPLNKIDRAMGLEGKLPKIFETFFEDLGAGYSNEETTLDNLLAFITPAMEAINDKRDNESILQDARMFYVVMQDQHEANPDRNDTPSAQDVYKAIKKQLLPQAGKVEYDSLRERVQMLESAYLEDGVLDIDKMRSDLTDAEKEYIQERAKMQKQAESLGRTATSVVRGEAFIPIANYISHMNNLSSKDQLKIVEEQAMNAISGEGGFARKPSTKAGALNKRQEKAVPAIIPSIFAADKKMARSVSRDYNMTLPLKVATRTVNNLMKKFVEDGDENAIANLNLVKDVMSKSIEYHLLSSGYRDGEIKGNKFVDYIIRKGYQYGLGTPVRAFAELASNIGYIVIAEPSAAKSGVKFVTTHLLNKRKREDKLFKMAKLLNRVPTKQASRLLGREISSVWAEAGAFDSKEYKSKVGRYIDGVSENLLQKPDVTAAQMVWFGTFSNAYDDIMRRSGSDKKFNLDTFSELEYIENKRAFDTAARKADDALSNAVATNNPYAGVLASTKKPTDNILQIFDNYLTRFQRFEREALKEGLDNFVGGLKKADKEQTTKGAKYMGASIARYALYNGVLTGTIGLIASFWGDDDEDDGGVFRGVYNLVNADTKQKRQEESYKLLRELLSFMGTMATGKMGNLAKSSIALGMEYANMKLGGGVTRPEGKEYDGFDDGVFYSPLDPTFIEGRELKVKDISFLGGAAAPIIKHTAEAIVNVNRYAQTDDEKYLEKFLYRNVPALIGASSGIPIKDLERLGNRRVYGDNKEYVNSLNDMRTGVFETYDFDDMELPEVDWEELENIE